MNTLFADVIQNYFKNAEIKIAGLNIWDKSKNIIHTDFALYENTVIKASATYKVGRVVTFIPRKIKAILKRIFK